MPTISQPPGLVALGWDDRWASTLVALGDPTLSAARVSRVDRGICTAMTGVDEVRVTFDRGVDIAVGDWVGIGPASESEMSRIVEVLPRRCVFARSTDDRGGAVQIVAANIDTVLVCDALDGSLSLRHLERFLSLAWQSGATPVVLITKSDHASASVLAETLEAATSVAEGVDVLVVSSTTGAGMNALARYLVPGQTLALLGLSGAGKSTLVNLLAGSQVLATGEVRSDGSGRHTTTHRELVLLPGGALLIDTPGMRALSVGNAGEGVKQAFADVEELAHHCAHSDCSHKGEDGCAIAAAISDGRLDRGRFESWLRLRGEPEDEHEIARGDVTERKRRKAAKFVERRDARSSLTPAPLED